MKLIDKYILKKYFQTYFFVVMILIAVIIVIDYTEKSANFIEHQVPVKEIIFDYFLSFIPFIINTLSPIAIFISTVFFTSKMASHTEIIAILSGGMSFRRFLLPYFLGSLVLGIMVFFLVGWIIPNMAKVKQEFENKYINDPFFYDEKNTHFKVSDSTYAYLESYSNINNIGYKFTLEKIRNNELQEKLSADNIVWDSTMVKWKVDRYYYHTFDTMKEIMAEGRSVDTVFNLTDKDFINKHNMQETMTFDELDAYIDAQLERGLGNVGLYLHEKYQRQAYPFAIVILSLMGAIISSKKSRRGTGVQIAIGFVLAFIYILFALLSKSVAEVGSISPLVSAWLPNATFFSITVFLYFTVPR